MDSKTLARFVDTDGRITTIPTKFAKRQAFLEWLVGDFAPGERYPEKQVNEILARRHEDVAALRRYLVDAGLMAREAGVYWRTESVTHLPDDPDSGAIAAASELARSCGLEVTDATVLWRSNNIVVHLTPANTVARVAPTGREIANFEVALVQQLSGAASPVAPLDPRVDPRAYQLDGYTVTFWEYQAPSGSPVPSLAYADALIRLHEGLRAVDMPVARFTARIDQAEQIVASAQRSPALNDDDRGFLLGRLVELRRSIDSLNPVEQLLHGEPHPGNVLATAGGPLFIDWETCCRGPVEFDFAHVPTDVATQASNLDLTLLDACRELVLALVAAWRWERDDKFPNGLQFGTELLEVLRSGPPWPTLDTWNWD